MSEIVLVADHSLPMEEREFGRATARRRSEVVVELGLRLGEAVRSVVLYAETARLTTFAEAVEGYRADWMDYIYGSNLARGMDLGLQACVEGGVTRMVLVSASQPSAHVTSRGHVFFNYPPVRESLQATRDEATACGSAGVRIDALVLGGFGEDAAERLVSLAAFFEEIVGATGGRVVSAASDLPVEAAVARFIAASGSAP